MNLSGIVRKIPLFGPLVDARARDYGDALLESTLNLLLSTIPIWLGAIFLYTFQATDRKGWWSLILDNLSNGELFIYCASLVGPIFYLTVKDYRSYRKIPSIGFIFIFAFVVVIIATGLFSWLRAVTLLDQAAKLDLEFILLMSYVLFGVSATLAYLVQVYNNFGESGTPALMREQTDEFVRSFNERGGSHNED